MVNNPSKIYVGSKKLIVQDKDLSISFTVLLHYPTLQQSSPTLFGPYIMDVSENASIINGQFPLVIISHGNGGSHLLYRSISTILAKNGYIVAMVEQFGNNRNDNHLENTSENLVYRPKHITLVIDYFLAQYELRFNILKDKIAVIGHSMGGYTALALAGGIPRTKEGMTINAKSDPRIKAIILLAPGAGWFRNSLNLVVVPILLLAAEHDEITPLWNSEIILEGVPNKNQVSFRIVKNAGHFSFLSPFPQTMKKPTFLPSTDPVGFDREQFHIELPVEILSFLGEKLA